MVIINGYYAAQISEINDLIIKYREGLTDGNMNPNGGFSVKNTKTNMPDTIRTTFNKMNLDVVHVNGQICGFIVNPGNPDIRKFHFLNQNGAITDKLDINGIKAWYTRPQQSQKPSEQEE